MVIPKRWWERIHNPCATAVLDVLARASIATVDLRVRVGHAELADELGLLIDDKRGMGAHRVPCAPQLCPQCAGSEPVDSRLGLGTTCAEP